MSGRPSAKDGQSAPGEQAEAELPNDGCRRSRWEPRRAEPTEQQGVLDRPHWLGHGEQDKQRPEQGGHKQRDAALHAR